MDYLKNKTVRDAHGKVLIAVDDLKQAAQDFSERRAIERLTDVVGPRDFQSAKKAARNDPQLQAAFPEPRPAIDGVKS